MNVALALVGKPNIVVTGTTLIIFRNELHEKPRVHSRGFKLACRLKPALHFYCFTNGILLMPSLVRSTME